LAFEPELHTHPLRFARRRPQQLHGGNVKTGRRFQGHVNRRTGLEFLDQEILQLGRAADVDATSR